MRKSLGLTENTQLMAISDSDTKEIRIIPLQLSGNKTYIKIQIYLNDKPGSLANVANAFGDLGMSLVYGESIIIKKGVEAEWTVIAPQPEISMEELKSFLIKNGGAIKVNILANKFHALQEENEN
jgi:hypothetical protein